MLINILLTLLVIAILVILFLYLKIKNATNQSIQNEIDQKVASEKAAIKVELERRVEESKEKVKDVKEAIDSRNAVLERLRSDN